MADVHCRAVFLDCILSAVTRHWTESSQPPWRRSPGGHTTVTGEYDRGCLGARKMGRPAICRWRTPGAVTLLSAAIDLCAGAAGENETENVGAKCGVRVRKWGGSRTR